MSVDQIMQNITNQSSQSNIRGGSFSNPYKARKYSKMASPRNSFAASPQKKRLRFSDTSTLIVTQPKTTEEMRSSWYSKQDVEEFKRKSRVAAQALRGTQPAKAMKHVAHSVVSNRPQSEFTLHHVEVFRGLEHIINPEVGKTLFQRRRLNITRVLREQDRQRSTGEENQDRIAQVSIENSRFAKEWRCRIVGLKEM
jgi:hypothetical protein